MDDANETTGESSQTSSLNDVKEAILSTKEQVMGGNNTIMNVKSAQNGTNDDECSPRDDHGNKDEMDSSRGTKRDREDCVTDESIDDNVRPMKMITTECPPDSIPNNRVNANVSNNTNEAYQRRLAQNRRTAQVRRDRKKQNLDLLQDQNNALLFRNKVLKEENEILKRNHGGLLSLLNNLQKPPTPNNISDQPFDSTMSISNNNSNQLTLLQELLRISGTAQPQSTQNNNILNSLQPLLSNDSSPNHINQLLSMLPSMIQSTGLSNNNLLQQNNHFPGGLAQYQEQITQQQAVGPTDVNHGSTIQQQKNSEVLNTTSSTSHQTTQNGENDIPNVASNINNTSPGFVSNNIPSDLYSSLLQISQLLQQQHNVEGTSSTNFLPLQDLLAMSMLQGIVQSHQSQPSTNNNAQTNQDVETEVHNHNEHNTKNK